MVKINLHSHVAQLSPQVMVDFNQPFLIRETRFFGHDNIELQQIIPIFQVFNMKVMNFQASVITLNRFLTNHIKFRNFLRVNVDWVDVDDQTNAKITFKIAFDVVDNFMCIIQTVITVELNVHNSENHISPILVNHQIVEPKNMFILLKM